MGAQIGAFITGAAPPLGHGRVAVLRLEEQVGDLMALLNRQRIGRSRTPLALQPGVAGIAGSGRPRALGKHLPIGRVLMGHWSAGLLSSPWPLAPSGCQTDQLEDSLVASTVTNPLRRYA